MMGRLTVEEWQPLIASSLIYEKKLTRTLRRRIVYAIGLMFLLLGGPLIASALLRMVWIAVFYVVFVVPAFLLARHLYYPYVKEARLMADSEASEVVGRDSLLDVFKKIDMMGLWDIEKRKTGRGIWNSRSSGMPSITERIDNLERRSI
jgi:MFS family permease